MSFKKGIALLVAFLMLVSNTGFAMTVHYCGGKISSISSGTRSVESCEMPELEAEKACCAKKAETDKPTIEIGHKKCCTDKTVNLKGKAIDTILKMASVDYTTPFLMPEQKPVFFGLLESVTVNKIPSYDCDAHAPPLFKLYHQFIFYA